MRVAFLEDVPNVAKSGEIKEVADGYARNFLIPRKLAALVNPKITNQLEAELKAKNKKQSQIAEKLAKMAEQLDGKEIILKAKVGAKARLYGSITSADIAQELTRSSGLDIDKRKVELAEPIREMGSFEVAVRLAKGIVPKIRVNIIEKEAS
jgi:large subunit ribosomal protein L9